MSNINAQFFSAQEVKANLHLQLINYLISYNNDENAQSRFDIHISSDGDDLCVEWCDTSFGEHFEYIDIDHSVLKELIFPDNHIEYVFDDEEENVYQNWLKQHPEYNREASTAPASYYSGEEEDEEENANEEENTSNDTDNGTYDDNNDQDNKED